MLRMAFSHLEMCALSLRCHGYLPRHVLPTTRPSNHVVHLPSLVCRVVPQQWIGCTVGTRRWTEWATQDPYTAPALPADTAVSEAVSAGEEAGEEFQLSTETAAKQQSRATGLLYKLPHVSTPDELVASAVNRARRVGRNKKLSGPAAQARNLAARQMDTLMKELTTPLTTCLKGFPVVDQLHEFEAALLDLTVSQGRYYRVLAKVLQLRKTTTKIGKEFAARCGRAASKKEAERIMEEGFETMTAVFLKNRGALIDLIDVTRKLRQLPKLDLGIPTLALVGAPNVGKSSLVQSISSGRPEICNYPFTTRSIKMGHFYVDGRRHQVTDTPGLLNRSDEEKNSLELLTMATLRFLPTAVVFVVDATEECGTSIEDQLAIRSHLKASFESKPWIDIFSKADLLQEAIRQANASSPTPLLQSEIDELSKSAQVLCKLSHAQKLSCVSEEGMDAFKESIIRLFSSWQADEENP